jgi:hypothetical protein
MSELKPCPFCGTLPQANAWIFRGISETRYFCPNQECPLSVRTVTLEQWNRRPIEDALRARIAELELRLDVYNGNMYDVVVDENAKLEAERRWIPVGERLPEEKQNVLALDRTGTAYHWEYSKCLSNIFVSDYTHWMPLPKPPEVS